jgi:ABC-2 type transport system permease protein
MENNQGKTEDRSEGYLMYGPWQVLKKTFTIFEFEVRKLRHDPIEVFVRLIQPILWLVIFGSVFNKYRIIDTGNLSYLSYLTPGVMAQSLLFTAIFYGIAITWDKDSGILAKLMATPTSRGSIIIGKALSAGVRGLLQSVVIVLIALLLGVTFAFGVVNVIGIIIVIVLSSTCFASLSIVFASFLRKRERFMGVIQLITMPLFFASNALYPIELMPQPLQYVTWFNPLYYVVDSLRALLITNDLSSVPIHIGVLLLITILFVLAGIQGLKRLME